jgi:multicomponent Na+:H+ antiporter subunit B
MLGVSVFILFRGHDEPGGGFVGGLVAALAVTIIALADGVPAARRRLRAHPVVMIGCGIALAMLSGMPGVFIDGSFLSHQWLHFGSDFKLGTTMLYDLGVYLVIMGGMLALVFRLYEEET